MIDIDRLSKRFSGRTVVNDLSFRIDRGEIVGLLGPNGAGKSTTLKMLSGFLAPSAGSVRIFGFDMQDKARQAQKLIGYLPENAPSYGEMTVEGFLAFVASIRDYSGRENVGASTAPWTAWSCGMSAGASSKPCPRASSAASRWPRRSSTIPSCSCSTSPPTASTRIRSTRSGNW